MGNASFLEASRRSWKEGGAISESEYKDTQSARVILSVLARGLLVVFCFFFSLVVVVFWSWAARGLLVVFCFFLVALVGGEAVRGATRSLELAVGGESGRRTRDADWRRRSASCVARTCASV